MHRFFACISNGFVTSSSYVLVFAIVCGPSLHFCLYLQWFGQWGLFFACIYNAREQWFQENEGNAIKNNTFLVFLLNLDPPRINDFIEHSNENVCFCGSSKQRQT
jgi:hypothetical protein